MGVSVQPLGLFFPCLQCILKHCSGLYFFQDLDLVDLLMLSVTADFTTLFPSVWCLEEKLHYIPVSAIHSCHRQFIYSTRVEWQLPVVQKLYYRA